MPAAAGVASLRVGRATGWVIPDERVLPALRPQPAERNAAARAHSAELLHGRRVGICYECY